MPRKTRDFWSTCPRRHHAKARTYEKETYSLFVLSLDMVRIASPLASAPENPGV